ncbi:hypothetical protein [Persephonella sp.]
MKRYQILDIYSNSYGIVIWLIGENGERLSTFRRFHPYFYIRTDSPKPLKLLKNRFKNEIKITKTVKKELIDGEVEVFKITARTPAVYGKAVRFVRKHPAFTELGLYNLQLTPPQIFMYERGIFPFCIVEEYPTPQGIKLKKVDSHEKLNYTLFPLRIMEINPETEGANPRYLRHIPPLVVRYEGVELVLDNQIEELSHLLKKKTLTC